MPNPVNINKRTCTNRLRLTYAHAGIFDIKEKQVWIAKKRWDGSAVRVSHARLLAGGSNDTSTASKDRYMCYTYHTPNSGEGHVQGYPIEWDEAHLFVRLIPNWNYLTGKLIPPTDSAKIDRNIEHQCDCAKRIFNLYLAAGPKFPLSWHTIGPRPTDSMFYVERVEP